MKSIYWISTTLLSIFLVWSAYTYIFSRQTIDGIKELGFPDHLRIQLAVLKLIACFLIMIPQIPIQMKEWAYAGVAFFLLTAIVAHFANKDPIIINVINFVLVAVLIVSYIYFHKVRLGV